MCLTVALREMEAMIIFYLHSTGQCGGIRVVLEMVSRLNEAGHHCELWTPPTAKATWFKRPLNHRMFNSLDQLGKAARETRAHKIATWWETASWVQETLRHDDKGFYLTQDIETTYSSSPAQDAAILKTYQMGLTPLATSRWVEHQLKEKVKSDIAPVFVGLGIDRDMFAPLPMAREQFRIFTPYRPNAGPRDLKGWLCARVAADHCRRLVPDASLVTFGNGPAPHDIPEGLPHIHVSNPNDGKLRELYAQAGVFLMASNHEGFGLTALEAMSCACPTVVTNCHGNGEYAKHETNCLSSDPGDSLGLASQLAQVMNDSVLASRLGYQGVETAKGYLWQYAIERLTKALGLV